jgi:hypothetical protein
MKVKDLLKNIEEYRKKYPDIDNWEVYTEQPDLIAPLNYVSFETYLQETDSDENEEEYMEIQKSYDKIKRLEKAGWKFKYDSEGWVYRDIADDGNHTLFEKDKIITINNNY